MKNLNQVDFRGVLLEVVIHRLMNQRPVAVNPPAEAPEPGFPEGDWFFFYLLKAVLLLSKDVLDGAWGLYCMHKPSYQFPLSGIYIMLLLSFHG
jgi:hypothetical protein